MGLIPGPLIAGPEPLGVRYGLLSAAAGPIDLPDKARGGGVRYIPVTCGQANLYPIDCSGGLVLRRDKIGDADDTIIDTGSYAVYASLECGSVGYTATELATQVQRRLLSGEQGAAEYALWTGRSRDLSSLGIMSLDGPTTSTVTVDDGDLVEVLAALEDYAYRVQGYGHVAYVHAPTSMASWAAANQLIIRRAPVMYTPYGSVWVFGGGYPGTGPSGALPPVGGAYLHITGQVTVWRSPDIFTYPVDQTMDRQTNQHFLLAEREYAVSFDCFSGRALFNPLGCS